MCAMEFHGKGYVLREENRGDLRIELGKVVTGDLPTEYASKRPIVAVGDVVTEVLYRQGVTPDVGVIDNKTRRGDYTHEIRYPGKKVRVVNPPGMITRDAWDAIRDALNTPEPVLVMVDGEEDLLSIISIMLCPEGGIVIYGIPSKGMIINLVDQEKKEKCQQAINNMIKVE